MPDAISASSSDDGPTSGTTRMPARAPRRRAPRRDRRRPGSRRRTGARCRAPARAGASSAASAAASASCRQRADVERRRSARGGASDFRNARAGFGVSTTQCAQPARDGDRARRQHVVGRRRRPAGWERGRACPRISAAARRSAEHVDAFGAQHARRARSAAGRSAPSDRRSRCARRARCRAPPSCTDPAQS